MKKYTRPIIILGLIYVLIIGSVYGATSLKSVKVTKINGEKVLLDGIIDSDK